MNDRMTLEQALGRLRELEQIARMAQPILATLALRKGDRLQAQAAKVLVQVEALGVR